MEHLGFINCQADLDVWQHENTDESDHHFYEYVLIYTDDILAIGKDPCTILQQLNKYFKMKGSSIGMPNIYLGTKIWSLTASSRKKIWTQGSGAYIQEAMKNVEERLVECNMKLPTCSDTPMLTGYCLELDTSPELDVKMVNWYQSAIGVLW